MLQYSFRFIRVYSKCLRDRALLINMKKWKVFPSMVKAVWVQRFFSAIRNPELRKIFHAQFLAFAGFNRKWKQLRNRPSKASATYLPTTHCLSNLMTAYISLNLHLATWIWICRSVELPITNCKRRLEREVKRDTFETSFQLRFNEFCASLVLSVIVCQPLIDFFSPTFLFAFHLNSHCITFVFYLPTFLSSFKLMVQFAQKWELLPNQFKSTDCCLDI